MAERQRYSLSAGGRLWLLAGLFFVMLLIAGLAQGIFAGIMSERSALLSSSVVQSLLVFIFPVWLVGRMNYGEEAARHLGVSGTVTLPALLSGGLILVLSIPLLDQIIYWNSEIRFPDSLRSLENLFKSWEESNGAVSEKILSGMSVIDLIEEIAVVGILTGFAEEFFFRVGIQGTLVQTGMGRNTAVWLAAFIFSALHLQFYGFIPRLLLGALFGYFYLWSRSVWLSSFTHALNNSIVVIFTWLESRGYFVSAPDSFGVIKHGFPYPALISLLCLAVAIYFLLPVLKGSRAVEKHKE